MAMNPRSRSENAQKAASSFSNHEFDFGLGPSFSKPSSSAPLKQQSSAYSSSPSPSPSPHAAGMATSSWAQKPVQSPYATWSSASSSSSSSSYSVSSSSSSASASSWTWQSNPSSSSSSSSSSLGPRSMVGDITGKNWGPMDSSYVKPSAATSSIVGSLNRGASPDLFGDLIGPSSRFGTSGSSSSSSVSSNKKQQEPSKSSVFPNIQSMASSLPRGVPLKDIKVGKSMTDDVMGDFVSATQPNGKGSNSQNNEDDSWGAFESLSSSSSTYTPAAVSSRDGDDLFGGFQGTSSASATANIDPFTSSSSTSTLNGDPFHKSKPSKAQLSDPFSFINIEKTTYARPPKSSSPLDPFESVFGKISSSNPISNSSPQQNNSSTFDPFESVLGKAASSNAGANSSSRMKSSDETDLDSLFESKKKDQPTNMEDDWGFEASFGGDNNASSPPELSDLPPPPSGVSASLAKDKGLGYYKQGQFGDAIKWLSWAENMLQKSGGTDHLIEVLTCRSSCLKEAGEYKKAVADCTKVIELDNGNVAIMLQRALLYESMEKYKLGIADLKEVLKREPQNRVASNTLSRLKKMAD